ncbi:LacI family DNA-binding transcriptional regulator [Vagococcus silagei]|uniref:LacI family transcriptional regulator n=1 Tax=Vagococcus silagei TaxID=2508885 RepID=A0A4S3B7H2_9ENTE|nr:LacI family DNA-binding transcriptional regulator [Vagococcus silagei]THB62010.1 LacI family transcriptional regulator [Vagococcus silagei]
MPTIKDIAKFTGVSPTTVSNVLHGRFEKVSPETKQKVESALKELDYSSHMAGRLLGKHGSKIIGVIIQDQDALDEQFYDNPYHGELIQALEYHIREQGYFMMFHRVSDFEEGVRLVNMWDLEGVIVSGARTEDIADWQKRISRPIVFLDTYGEDENQAKLNVGLDDYDGAYQMTKYLIENGHQNLMFLAKAENPEDWAGVDAFRSQGFLAATKEYQVNGKLKGLKSTYQHNQSAIETLVASNFEDCTVLFFASDLLAIQAIAEFSRLGVKAAVDISIAGFDGTPYSRYATPQIASVFQNLKEKASLATNLLVSAIHLGEQHQADIKMKGTILPGQSIRILN